jgi:hypothetical protein
MLEPARVCMVTYGDSAASLPPLLHEGLSLASAGFQVDSLHSDARRPAPIRTRPGSAAIGFH